MAVAVARSGSGSTIAGPVVFRPDFAWHDQAYFERRQAFLRSYQLGGGTGKGVGVGNNNNELLDQKRSSCASFASSTCYALSSAARRSLSRVRRAVGSRLRSARRFRRLVWARLRRHTRRAVRRLGLATRSRSRRGGAAGAVLGLTARDWFGTPARYYYW